MIGPEFGIKGDKLEPVPDPAGPMKGLPNGEEREEIGADGDEEDEDEVAPVGMRIFPCSRSNSIVLNTTGNIFGSGAVSESLSVDVAEFD